MQTLWVQSRSGQEWFGYTRAALWGTLGGHLNKMDQSHTVGRGETDEMQKNTEYNLYPTFCRANSEGAYKDCVTQFELGDT